MRNNKDVQFDFFFHNENNVIVKTIDFHLNCALSRIVCACVGVSVCEYEYYYTRPKGKFSFTSPHSVPHHTVFHPILSHTHTPSDNTNIYYFVVYNNLHSL